MKLHKLKSLFIYDIPIEYRDRFNKENLSLSLARMRVLCIAFAILSFYFIFKDITMFDNINNMEFRKTIAFFHINSLVCTCFYLLIYKKIKENIDSKMTIFISHIYILAFIIAGTVISLSSQRFTGNIDGYIIFTFIAAITFSYEPLFMLISLVVNHLLLMIGLSYLIHDYILLFSKQINATLVFFVSIFLFFHLYKFRAIEFNNNCKLSKSEANFKKLFRVNPTPLIISRYEDGIILFANQRAYEFYEYTEEEFHQMSFVNLYIDIKDRLNMTVELSQSGIIRNYIIEQKLKSGTTKWVIANYELIKYNDQDCIITSITDITEIKKLENELSNHASIDTLTGVLNRRKGIEILENMVKISKNNQSSFVACFVDIDGLKYVNDKYGHNEGDFLITTIATVIKRNIRSIDVLFRYGGDEFIILFPYTNAYYVETNWNRIKQGFHKINNSNLKPYIVDASHGIFEYNGHTNLTVNEMLNIADKNMYTEKMKKRGIIIKD